MWWAVAKFVFYVALSYYLRPDPQTPDDAQAASIEELEVPTAEAGTPISVLFGRRQFKAPNCIWYGHLKTDPIKKTYSSDGFLGIGGGSKTVTTGYRYSLGMHLVLCHGPVDEVSEIRVGGRTAWGGSVTSTQQINISAEGLFGGQDREGGISGDVDVEFGEADQPKNPYLTGDYADSGDWGLFTSSGNPWAFEGLDKVPAYRGLLGLVCRQVYIGTLPRLKPWHITAKREPASWSGAPSGLIGEDANPAHIVYEAITNPVWGMGYSDSRIDTSSLTDAANTLAGEGFGLSIEWRKANQSVEAFIVDVTRYIDASLYLDPADGKFRLNLHRADYTIADLRALDQGNVVEVHDFSRPGWADLTNEITVVYTDGEGSQPSWKQASITQQNQAAVRAQGGRVVSQQNRYPAITKGALANQVLARDLHQAAQPLARVELTLLPSEGDIRPGEVIKWADSDYGVQQLLLRVVECDYGTLGDGRVRIKTIEDAFATRAAVFADPTPTDWVDPVNDPAAAPYRRLMEATYYHLALDAGGSDTLLGEIADQTGFLMTQAVRPSGDALDYEVHVDTGSGYSIDGEVGDFCAFAELAQAVGGGDTQLALDAATAEDIAQLETDTWAYLGNEIIAVRAFDTSTGVITVDRGVIDTVPKAHAAGTRVFFGQNYESVSPTEYTDGEQIDVKLLPRTGLGRLQLDQAPADSITFDARFIRPYPPGRVRFNGLDWPDKVDGALTLGWAHRDRTQQTGPLIDQDAGDIGPEPGTSYTLRIYDGAGTLVRTETVQGTDYTYATADELADGGPFTTLTWQLEAERDGWISWQYQQRTADLYGYGRRYGQAYGGLA